MKYKSMMAAVALLLLDGTAVQADQIDDRLRADRKSMVSAVAVLSFLPSNCTPDHKIPDPDQVARWINGLGYHDDAFMAEVKEKMKSMDDDMRYRFSESDKKSIAEMTCAYGVLLAAKVRDANK